MKDAIKAAVDAGLYERARAFLDVLQKTSPPAAVVNLRELPRLEATPGRTDVVPPMLGARARREGPELREGAVAEAVTPGAGPVEKM